MKTRNIIVIGASAGGFEAIKQLKAGLPADLAAAIFIVWHMAPDIRGVLPQVLNRTGGLPAAHARDRDSIESGRIYVAPPDRHLLVENGRMRVTRGPKENRFRPAVDPLFRSAAYHYGPNVIGIVLSGALDDGTAGLWTIKHRGGTAIVQHPNDAEVPSMPENALREVAVDHVVPVANMPELIVRLIDESETRTGEAVMEIDEREKEKTETEIRIAAEDNALEESSLDIGELSQYACPDCHGVLSSIRDGQITRFRCHTGHAYSANSLLATITDYIEDSLWDAVRGMDESIMMLNHMGDHFADGNEPKLAALYFKKAKEAAGRNEQIRKVVFSHERLSKESIREQADEANGDYSERRISTGRGNSGRENEEQNPTNNERE